VAANDGGGANREKTTTAIKPNIGFFILPTSSFHLRGWLAYSGNNDPFRDLFIKIASFSASNAVVSSD
jgi:hypothetical protein